MMLTQTFSFIKLFDISGNLKEVNTFGSGHINDTYLACYDQKGKERKYIIQRINHQVFKSPEKIMRNIGMVSEHVAHKDILFLNPIKNRDTGDYLVIDEKGNYWRAFPYIDKSVAPEKVENEEQAFQAASAFGRFLRMIDDIDVSQFEETIPDFHNAQSRFQKLTTAIENDSFDRAKSCQPEIEFALKYKPLTEKITKLLVNGSIPVRVTHNDTKISNALLDSETNKAICVIDLDTIMPGTSLYDYGDMIRTFTSPCFEDETDLNKVYMRFEIFKALTAGFLSELKDVLIEKEKENLVYGGKLITYLIGIKLLTDHLEGDNYHKISYQGQNLDRARNQFKLLRSIEEQEDAMQEFIKGLG
ncbi:aminoglycoside phosphotransferase family protein [Fulvivirgaceae bacterium BMA10]|uniref:Aminoglycoside phosphotransferase family protein n=1 Tax=Splendidivirga corallicola TaxID=3051826 RepID=A0ABT8KS82_9BACT|nr:aminoglycoside phosphotransferase family protein [Fulvivirgaceae bacterium BMA10]